MATNFGTKLLLTGFVWTILTRQLVMKWVWVVVDRMQILPIACTKGCCHGNPLLPFDGL